MARWLTDDPQDVWPNADPKRATRWVMRAEALIAQRFPTLEERVTLGTLNPVVVAGVVEDMVTRVLDREARDKVDKVSYPEVTVEWETGGGLSKESTLYLTSDEYALLSDGPTGGVFSITPSAKVVPQEPWL